MSFDGAVQWGDPLNGPGGTATLPGSIVDSNLTALVDFA
jgi:hypothetical protein